jgi:signal transduction histidine kinase
VITHDRTRRTHLAIVLTAFAIAAPCAAWYLVGSAATAREASALRERPLQRGHEVARALADRLIGRLEAMRDSESQRPPYHFQPSFHDPTSTCQCASRTPSPLATGPRDPFVELYFEIDGTGGLHAPVLGEAPEDVLADPDDLQSAHERRLELLPFASQLVDMAHGRVGETLPVVDRVLRPATTVLPGAALRDRLVSETDPFQWHGITTESSSLLVALRRVGTQPTSPVQGFVLAPAAVQDWLRTADLPARLRPGRDLADRHEAVADVQLDCTRWEIAVDVSEALAEAEATAARVEAGFVRSFAVGTGFAVLAGAAVIFLLLSTERMARQRARFAAAAAHELRTPLTGLRLYGEMLGGSLDDPDTTQRYARRITEETTRLSRVVTNVLGFTRLERGGVQVQAREGDLAAHVQSVVERMRPTLTSSGASVEFTVTCPSACARFDPDAVDHIVQNLLDNAEKYGRNGLDRRILVSVRPAGPRIEVVVRDHGPGVSEEVARRIFEPFVRGDHPDQPAGLGLGLPLVDSLARAHGAPPRWRNHPEGGAEFVVSFEPI